MAGRLQPRDIMRVQRLRKRHLYPWAVTLGDETLAWAATRGEAHGIRQRLFTLDILFGDLGGRTVVDQMVDEQAAAMLMAFREESRPARESRAGEQLAMFG